VSEQLHTLATLSWRKNPQKPLDRMLDWDQYQFGCGLKKKIAPSQELKPSLSEPDYNTSVIILILKMDEVCSFDNGTHLQN
jgi:hypothetical protein